MGGCGFSVDRLVAACDGEAVVCGVSAVDAGVEGDGCWVVLDGGVECVGAGFAASAPVVGVCGGFACVWSRAVVALFNRGLGCACVSGLFSGVLCACVGDPCVGDGSEGLVGVQGDGGGGVFALCAGVFLFVAVEGCVDGDSAVVVCVACVLALVCACGCACGCFCVLVCECVSCEGECAVCGGNDGFAD